MTLRVSNEPYDTPTSVVGVVDGGLVTRFTTPPMPPLPKPTGTVPRYTSMWSRLSSGRSERLTVSLRARDRGMPSR